MERGRTVGGSSCRSGVRSRGVAGEEDANATTFRVRVSQNFSMSTQIPSIRSKSGSIILHFNKALPSEACYSISTLRPVIHGCHRDSGTD